MDLTEIVNNAWEGYLQLQEAYPLIGSILTAEITFPLGDILSQLIKGPRKEGDPRIDWNQVKFTASIALAYGLGVYGLMQSGELVGATISERPFDKAALGPNLFGNLYNALFYINNTVGEKVDYSLKGLAQFYRKSFSDQNHSEELNPNKSWWQNFKTNYGGNIPKKEYFNSVLGTLTAWNLFHTLNFAYVPKNFTTPVALGVSVVWITMMSSWSIKGRRNIVYNNNNNNNNNNK